MPAALDGSTPNGPTRSYPSSERVQAIVDRFEAECRPTPAKVSPGQQKRVDQLVARLSRARGNESIHVIDDLGKTGEAASAAVPKLMMNLAGQNLLDMTSPSTVPGATARALAEIFGKDLPYNAYATLVVDVNPTVFFTYRAVYDNATSAVVPCTILAMERAAARSRDVTVARFFIGTLEQMRKKSTLGPYRADVTRTLKMMSMDHPDDGVRKRAEEVSLAFAGDAK